MSGPPKPAPATCLYDIHIDQDKIEKIMSNFDATNAMEPEGIPVILLKKCCKSLSLPLTILCRKSLKIGKISPRLKASYIHPQLKQGGKRSNPVSWRPIALTSQLSKVFEKYLKEVIMNHLEQNNLLGDHQFGFRSKRSCLAQMLSYYEKFSKKLKMAKM